MNDTPAPVRLNLLQRQVLRFARLQGGVGFTDLALQSFYHNHGSTYRTRRAELVAKGLIAATSKRDRLNGEARGRIVWVITPKGLAVK